VGVVRSDAEARELAFGQASVALGFVLIPAVLYLWPAAIPAYLVYLILLKMQVHPLFRGLACLAMFALIIYVVTRSAVLIALYFCFVGVALGGFATALLLYYTHDLVWTVSGGSVASFLLVLVSQRFGYVFSPRRRQSGRDRPSDQWYRGALISSAVLTCAVVAGIVYAPDATLALIE
jgi:hypothetical protein